MKEFIKNIPPVFEPNKRNLLDLFSVHEKENNAESQKNLNENRGRFSDQCKRVYKILIEGGTLTVFGAVSNEGINALPRRILDLKEKGVLISDRWDDRTTSKSKVWFMTSAQIQTNKENFKIIL